MRVLQVIHDFLPRHNAGSEIYTYTLSRELRRRGHEVEVVFTEHRPEKKQYSVTRGEYREVPYREIVYNSEYQHFRETYLNPKIEELFEEFFDDFRPDILHLQHLQFLSLGVIELAKRRGIPVVYTLHEYCLTCCRHGLRMTEELDLCHDLEAEKCARCIRKEPVREPLHVPFRVTLRDRINRIVPARARRFVRKRLYSVGLVAEVEPSPQEFPDPVEDGDLEDHIEAIETRWKEVRAHLDQVDLFVAPSPFLRKKFLEFGVPEGKIVYSDYGFDVSEFPEVKRKPSEKLRFGFIGTIVEHKGVLTAVRAMGRVDHPDVELRVYGDTTFFPEYFARVQEESTPAVHFMGRFDNKDVASILAELDILIVPSLWFENSPLTIHEAFLAGVPVVTTDLGGMKDLVEDGVSGLLFERGNADSLAEKIRRLVEEPGLKERLSSGIPAVKSIADDAEWMEQRYARLVKEKAEETNPERRDS